jgi:hypothetical protein
MTKPEDVDRAPVHAVVTWLQQSLISQRKMEVAKPMFWIPFILVMIAGVPWMAAIANFAALTQPCGIKAFRTGWLFIARQCMFVLMGVLWSVRAVAESM